MTANTQTANKRGVRGETLGNSKRVGDLRIMETQTILPVFRNYARPRKELIGDKRVRTPKFNIEPCTDMNGDRVFIVRFRGEIVTTIPAQFTRQAARDKAARMWWVVRNPSKLAHIKCPF